jgi:hypothetical protein
MIWIRILNECGFEKRQILRDMRGRDERKGYGFGKEVQKKGKRG